MMIMTTDEVPLNADVIIVGGGLTGFVNLKSVMQSSNKTAIAHPFGIGFLACRMAIE